MDFRTRLDIAQSAFQISHHDKIMMLGSCFIENIGNYLLSNKFNTKINPFGIMYNPHSIAQSIDLLLENKTFTESDLFIHNGVYHSFYHHGRFSDVNAQKCLVKINRELTEGSMYIKNCDFLFLTFGSSYVYKYINEGLIVGNCHKLPANQFERDRLTTNEIIETWSEKIALLQNINPKLRVIFTVSPIRHTKDGMHDNQISKATLLLAIDELCKRNKNCCHYFPSYELVLDDLRDYRFYAEDMTHPNEMAIKYIWERFSETYLSPITCNIIKEWCKIQNAIQHRSLNETSIDNKHFLNQTLLRLKQFSNNYSYIYLTNEVYELEKRIARIEE